MIATVLPAPGATPYPTFCPISTSPTTSDAAISTGTTATELSAVSTEAGVEDPGAGMSASWFDFDNDGSRRSTSQTCGPPPAFAFPDKINSARVTLKTFAPSIANTLRVIRCIAIKATASSRMSAKRLASKWAAGRGLPTHGTSITTATLTSTSRMATFQAPISAMSPASSGGKWSRIRPPRPPRRFPTNKDGTPSTN